MCVGADVCVQLWTVKYVKWQQFWLFTANLKAGDNISDIINDTPFTDWQVDV